MANSQAIADTNSIKFALENPASCDDYLTITTNNVRYGTIQTHNLTTFTDEQKRFINSIESSIYGCGALHQYLTGNIPKKIMIELCKFKNKLLIDDLNSKY